MTDLNIINAEIREDVGKGASRRLRHQGMVPAVVYGGRKDPATLKIEHGPLKHATERESFFSSILEIKVSDGRTQKVVVRDIQYHPFKAQILHLDFMRVSDEEILRMYVPIHYTGEDESEAGKASGVVIQHLVTEIEIEALPRNLPEFLEVDLSGLKAGGVVMLSDVIPPEGVEIPAMATEDADEIMIANTSVIRESQGEGEEVDEEDLLEDAVDGEVEGEDGDEDDREDTRQD